LVSLSVAVILFEGGLTLKLNEISGVRSVVFSLISVGIVVTWALSTAASYFILDLDFSISLLLGSILVVTGPTVIIPLLRHVRPTGRVGSILRWEGILIDPAGAVLALLVFEQIFIADDLRHVPTEALLIIGKTLLIGIGLGFISAEALILVIRRYWVPDYLQSPLTLMVIVSTFAISDSLQAESGLLTAPIMGIVLANQRRVTLRHIVEFKETLGVLLLSSLFIVLASRLTADVFDFINLKTLTFLVVLIFIIRPLTVFISTHNSNATIQEKIFLAAMAPRGIVAATVSSIFALELEETGFENADALVAYTFIIIIGTVTVYSLAASPIARWLGLAKPNPQGVIIVGAHDWAREMGRALNEEGITVHLVDTNQDNVAIARYEGLNATCTSVLSEGFIENLELSDIGRLMALTSNNEVNALATLNFRELFGRAEVYRLSEGDSSGHAPRYGRTLFGDHVDFEYLERHFVRGVGIQKKRLKKEENWRSDGFTPLFVVDDGNLTIYTKDNRPTPRPGQVVIGLGPSTQQDDFDEAVMARSA
ncbi:MAG: cation:proton antiporter, partial [Chloroflexi bacterium]|nr:cation:proton antiporter [Chloroflexota bacterium]